MISSTRPIPPAHCTAPHWRWPPMNRCPPSAGSSLMPDQLVSGYNYYFTSTGSSKLKFMLCHQAFTPYPTIQHPLRRPNSHLSRIHIVLQYLCKFPFFIFGGFGSRFELLVTPWPFVSGSTPGRYDQTAHTRTDVWMNWNGRGGCRWGRWN